jgi:DUF1680 family protein
MYEAAVAHFAATGKRTLLDVALKSADLLVDFRPGKMHTVPGQVTEMGLGEAYQVTGNSVPGSCGFLYPATGAGERPGRNVQPGSCSVLSKQRRPLCGQDTCMPAWLTGWAEAERSWRRSGRTLLHTSYITRHRRCGEHRGLPTPRTPNISVIPRTCAGIALAFWSHRMFLHSGDAKYMMSWNAYSTMGFSPSRPAIIFFPNPLESILERNDRVHLRLLSA